MQHLVESSYTIRSQQGDLFTITPELWQQNQQQQSVLLRYLALPLKEEPQKLWLGLDSLANLAACEAFSFLTGKNIEPVLIEPAVLKRPCRIWCHIKKNSMKINRSFIPSRLRSNKNNSPMSQRFSCLTKFLKTPPPKKPPIFI